jgi:hypothetical protein
VLTKGSSPISRTKESNSQYAYIINENCSWVGFQRRKISVPGHPKFLQETGGFCGVKDTEFKAPSMATKCLPLPHLKYFTLAVAQSTEL